MVGAIISFHLTKIEGVNTFQIRNIETILSWIRPPMVVRVNTTIRAEIMLSRHGIELVMHLLNHCYGVLNLYHPSELSR